MRSFLFLGLVALASAQSNSTVSAASDASSSTSTVLPSTPSSISSVVSSTTAPSSTVAAASTTTAKASIITVAQDGSGQYTAINPAISFAQNSGYPTVSIKAGVYTEAVSVVATQTVSIIGANPTPSDYTQNQVTVSNITIGSNSVQGISWRNLNILNPTGYAVSLRGTKNAFYDCSFISGTSGVITSTLGITLISGGYIEGTDKLFYNYPGMYVYNTIISPTISAALLVYTKGFTVSLIPLLFIFHVAPRDTFQTGQCAHLGAKRPS